MIAIVLPVLMNLPSYTLPINPSAVKRVEAKRTNKKKRGIKKNGN